MVDKWEIVGLEARGMLSPKGGSFVAGGKPAQRAKPPVKRKKMHRSPGRGDSRFGFYIIRSISSFGRCCHPCRGFNSTCLVPGAAPAAQAYPRLLFLRPQLINSGSIRARSDIITSPEQELSVSCNELLAWTSSLTPQYCTNSKYGRQ